MSPRKHGRRRRASIANQPPLVLFAFKADVELAAKLAELPNKSAFIREAVRHRLAQICLLCLGTGRKQLGVR